MEDNVESEEEEARMYKCFGCGSFTSVSVHGIKRHLNSSPSCRTRHINWLIDNENDIPANTEVCYGCGSYVHSGRIVGHLKFVPQKHCLEEHTRVIRDIKGLDVDEYFGNSKKGKCLGGF